MNISSKRTVIYISPLSWLSPRNINGLRGLTNRYGYLINHLYFVNTMCLPSWQLCFIAVLNGKIIGWALLDRTYPELESKGLRRAEINIFIHPNARKKGIGSKIMRRIMIEAPKHGVSCLTVFLAAGQVRSYTNLLGSLSL